MSLEILERINEISHSMSKSQKLIAEFIKNHSEKAAFMTAYRLGNVVGVSESTVVRFATLLGYEGYPQMQRAIQGMISSRLTAVQRMEVTENRIGAGDVLDKVLNHDIERIKLTIEETSRSDFASSVEAIINANRIYILGVRSSSALAGFLGFYFNLMFTNVRLIHTTSVSEIFEQIFRVTDGDVVIGISFPRYSRRTIEALKFAKDRNATVISITDSKKSPIAKNSDYCLLARSDMVSFVDSLVAPLSLINALIIAIGLRKRDEVISNFNDLESIWTNYNVYEQYNNSEKISD